jgi:DNA repair exonuclease SbcCD ATPase subunit
MFKTLELWNFRQVQHARHDFTPGLNLIRARNEGGKSTRLEAIAYALFGSRPLTTSLEEAVTWGKPPSALKVALTLEAGGRTLTFTRSKGSADVRAGDEIIVTGQADVSGYAAQLFGADGALAPNLFLASQSSLRGVLSEGPKASTDLLEKLADMTTFDTLLTLAGEKLLTGSTDVPEARVADLEAAREAITVPDQPDATALRASLKATLAPRKKRKSALSAAQEHMYSVSAECGAEYDKQQKRNGLVKQADYVRGQLADTRLRFDACKWALTAPEPATEGAQAAVQAAEAWATENALYQQFKPVVSRHDRNEWQATMQDTKRSQSVEQATIDGLKNGIAMMTGQIVKDVVCPTCNQPIQNAEEVIARNDTLHRRIKELREKLEAAGQALDKATQALRQLQAIEADDRAMLNLANRLHGRVSVDESVIPRALTWTAPIPDQNPPDLAALRHALSVAKTQQSEWQSARGKAEALQEQTVMLETSLAETQAQIDGLNMLPEADLEKLHRRMEAATQKRNSQQEELDQLESDARELITSYAGNKQQYREAMNKARAVEKQIQTLKQDIATIRFNNTLIKKIRAARPIVGAKLWQIVLASVNVTFSQIRGEPSIVTREKAGFYVNGYPVAGLSGSTLDALGLAIRVALTRTFLPGTNTLVLDEAMAACDDDRTAAMLGYIAACGFGQVLLATHERVSEGFAENIVIL